MTACAIGVWGKGIGQGPHATGDVVRQGAGDRFRITAWVGAGAQRGFIDGGIFIGGSQTAVGQADGQGGGRGIAIPVGNGVDKAVGSAAGRYGIISTGIGVAAIGIQGQGTVSPGNHAADAATNGGGGIGTGGHASHGAARGCAISAQHIHQGRGGADARQHVSVCLTAFGNTVGVGAGGRYIVNDINDQITCGCAITVRISNNHGEINMCVIAAGIIWQGVAVTDITFAGIGIIAIGSCQTITESLRCFAKRVASQSNCLQTIQRSKGNGT